MSRPLSTQLVGLLLGYVTVDIVEYDVPLASTAVQVNDPVRNIQKVVYATWSASTQLKSP